MDVTRRRVLQAGAASTLVLLCTSAGSNFSADGAVDDARALQDQLDSLAASGGTLVVGWHYLSTTLRPPPGVTIRGRDDRSGFVLPGTGEFAAITVDGVDRVVIEKLRVVSTARFPDSGTPEGQAAVSVRGGAAQTTISDVWADGLHDGFRTEGGAGATPGIVRDVLLNRCRATNSAVYGYVLDDVDGVDIAFCSSTVSGLDGVKLRKNTRNVTITSGRFTGSARGDGLDGYAGGRELVVQASEFSGNGINGITLKTDLLNKGDHGYGMPRAVTLTGLRCVDNGADGLWIGRTGNDDDPTVPLLSQVTVTGGSFDRNGTGIQVRARSVTLSGVQVSRNRGVGIRVDAAALDVVMMSPLVAGNGQAAEADGIHIAGRRVQVFGGVSIGVDPDAVASDADLAAAPPTQRFGIRIEPTAAETLLVGPTLRYNGAAGLSDASTDGALVLPGSGNSADPVVSLPNDRPLYGTATDDTAVRMASVTPEDVVSLGDDRAPIEILGSALTIATDVVARGGVGFNGAPPTGRAADPGRATGDDARVINAIVTVLRDLGLVD